MLTALRDDAHRPLDDELLKQISSSSKGLIECIECDSGLVAELFSLGCISQIQKQSIESLQGISKNEKLLHIMTLKSISEFKEFKTCLSRTNQHHIVAVLEGKAGLCINCLRPNMLYNRIYFSCSSADILKVNL